MLRDDHHFAVWCLTNSQLGASEAGTEALSILSRSTGDVFQTRSANGTGISTGNTNGAGLFALSRRNGADYDRYINGAMIGNTVQASAAFGGVYQIFFGARNSSGTPIFNNKRLAAISYGGALTDAQMLAMYQTLLSLNTAIGAA